MTRPIPFLGGPSSIVHATDHLEVTPVAPDQEEAPPNYNVKFVLHGRFKGTRDNRGQRCFNKECRHEGYACCSHCTTLPYKSLKLTKSTYSRSLLRLHLALDLWRTRRGILDTKLKLLIEELQEFAETDNIFRKLSVKNPHIPRATLVCDESMSPLRTCKHALAKGRFVKMRAKFWSAQANEERNCSIIKRSV